MPAALSCRNSPRLASFSSGESFFIFIERAVYQKQVGLTGAANRDIEHVPGTNRKPAQSTPPHPATDRIFPKAALRNPLREGLPCLLSPERRPAVSPSAR